MSTCKHISITIRTTHTHTRACARSLSLSHTHTYIHTQRCGQTSAVPEPRRTWHSWCSWAPPSRVSAPPNSWADPKHTHIYMTASRHMYMSVCLDMHVSVLLYAPCGRWTWMPRRVRSREGSGMPHCACASQSITIHP
jgi:hypothetical protein